ncbi:MAG: cation:proton antiporter [Pseudomonadota bacterium]
MVGLGLSLSFSAHPEDLRYFSKFGIVPIQFAIGLEFHPARLWELHRKILGQGLVLVLATGTSLGLSIDLHAVVSNIVLIAFAVPILITFKSLVIYLVSRLFKTGHPISLRLPLGMSQHGGFVCPLCRRPRRRYFDVRGKRYCG